MNRKPCIPKLINKLFFEHPNQVGETYCEHFKAAVNIGNRMVAFGIAEFVHAVVPAVDLFKANGTTSSKEIQKISHILNGRKVSDTE